MILTIHRDPDTVEMNHRARYLGLYCMYAVNCRWQLNV